MSIKIPVAITTAVEYLDTPIDLEINGIKCRYAPMRMEWAFGSAINTIDEMKLTLELEAPKQKRSTQETLTNVIAKRYAP